MVLAHEVQEPFREEKMEEQRNRFCQRDKALSFHKWDFYDVARWKFHKSNEHDVTGAYYLWAYKAAFLQYNRERIIRYARQEKVPLLLLAGTVVNEVGGKPDRGNILFTLKDFFLMMSKMAITVSPTPPPLARWQCSSVPLPKRWVLILPL